MSVIKGKMFPITYNQGDTREPIEGDTKFDSENGKLYTFSHQSWVPVNGLDNPEDSSGLTTKDLIIADLIFI